jgi:hypothetical protein
MSHYSTNSFFVVLRSKGGKQFVDFFCAVKKTLNQSKLFYNSIVDYPEIN